MAQVPEATPLGDAEYRVLTDRILSALEATVDRWLQEDVIDIDPQRTGGLLEMALPSGAKIIVNTQPPLHELWLATRLGGYHFRHVEGRWLDTKDGAEFHDRLSRDASRMAGRELRFTPP